MKKLICVMLVLVMALSLTACGGSGYKGVVKDYVNALNKQDAEKLLKLYPEEYVEYLIDEEIFEDEDEIVDQFEDYFEYIIEAWEDEYGDDIKISYKITDAEDMDEDDLEELQDYYDDEYGIEVKDAKELEVELTIKGEDDEDEEDIDLVVIKIGSKWYLEIDSGM